LQHLQLFFCEGEKVVIPGIASLGNVVMYKCDEVSHISVERPTDMTDIKQIREFPIYEMLVAECHELEEMSICRPISLLKIKNDSPCRRIHGRELVKEIQEVIYHETSQLDSNIEVCCDLVIYSLLCIFILI
jgi:hypothetical protein